MGGGVAAGSQSVNLNSDTASTLLKKSHGKGTYRCMDIATTLQIKAELVKTYMFVSNTKKILDLSLDLSYNS